MVKEEVMVSLGLVLDEFSIVLMKKFSTEVLLGSRLVWSTEVF